MPHSSAIHAALSASPNPKFRNGCRGGAQESDDLAEYLGNTFYWMEVSPRE